MNKQILTDGYVELSSEKGIIDTRTQKKHRVVICEEQKEKYFVEVEEEENAVEH